VGSLQSIPETTPLVALFPPSCLDALIPTIPLISELIVHTFNHLISVSTLAASVLSFEQNEEEKRAKEAKGDIPQHNSVAETIPWTVSSPILLGVDQEDELLHLNRTLTMFAVTAPFKLPKPMAIPSVTLRLYEPSTLLATQATEFAVNAVR
jgi:hypothetical protein